jgi:hypothetical protein
MYQEITNIPIPDCPVCGEEATLYFESNQYFCGCRKCMHQHLSLKARYTIELVINAWSDFVIDTICGKLPK